jgi:DNA replication protein DnaC
MSPETRFEELECESCHQKFTGEVSIFRFGPRERKVYSHECPECKAKREDQERLEGEEENRLRLIALREGWRKSCGIPLWMLDKTFENFEAGLQKTAYKQAFNYANQLSLDDAIGYPSLILYSEGNGVGKTHLAIAIVNKAIDSWNGDPDRSVCPIRFESGPGLIRRIRATYSIGIDAYHEREDDVYNQLRGVSLLILDDVGKEKPSEHTREVYFYIIDERYKAGLPVVITSNLPLDGQLSLSDLMGVSTVDRLIGMSRGKVIELRGKSYRQLRKQP